MLPLLPSLSVVPMKLPGVEVQAIKTLQDERTNITFFHDVHVPDRYRLSEVDGGMKLMTFLMTMEHRGREYEL
jgi:alkylation response protein AidB-like acyl-CoA dehydrogenase